MSKNTIACNGELQRGDSLVSNNGNFKAVFQEDNNFVIYGWSPIWSSNTYQKGGNRLVMQEDCNLVMYKGTSNVCNAVWASGSNRADHRTRVHARLQDDGTLVVKDNDTIMWRSK
ncbi:B-type lectin plumieribetin-like [Engraulis encrasicolus]|uniref:B-type lectin plumieribetin-like n=1 Tax=Engraulis encrasicolus TaxID=184585 RepID=UPI002FD05170